MCGRLRLPADYSEIKIALKLGDLFPAPNLEQSWNAAPSKDVLCIIRDEATGQRKPLKMRWGLIPEDSPTVKPKVTPHNARAETVRKLKEFAPAWKAGRRCLVVTDGFYEWRQKDTPPKQPFAVGTAHTYTVMAGIWNKWVGPVSETIYSFAIITTKANDVMAPIHDRMPVILAEADWPAWLGEVPATEQELLALLRPFPSDQMELWPVDKRVGNVRNNDSKLTDPIIPVEE